MTNSDEKNKLITLKLSKWSDVYAISDLLKTRIFRGQKEESWGLTTSLERVLKNDLTMYKDVEERILTEFKRAAHLYLDRLPQAEDWIEWLSLIQHYDGLTRLLDFSKSLFIALFFALEQDTSNNSSIWAINGYTVLTKLRNYGYMADEKYFNYDQNGKFFNDSFRKSYNKYSVGFARPFRFNERLINQQGTFLFPLNLNYSFEENLFGMLNVDQNDVKNLVFNDNDDLINDELIRAPIIKIIIENKFRHEGFNNLLKMNINHRTMYPGLAGYTKSSTYNALELIK